MHKVIPTIQSINEDTSIKLKNITVFSLYNKGTVDFAFSFGDGWETIKQGQTITYEAGANTVFSEESELKIKFEEATSASDFKHVAFTSNRLISISQVFRDTFKGL